MSASLYHQMSCLVTIKLGNSLEEIQKIGAILSIEFRYQTRIDEDELWSISFVIDLL